MTARPARILLCAILGIGLSHADFARAAEPPDAESLMAQGLRVGTAPSETIGRALSEAVCGGAAAHRATIGLILAAQDSGIADSEIGSGIGDAAVAVVSCNSAAAGEIARVIADMGTEGLRLAFVEHLGSEPEMAGLRTLAMRPPSIAFGGVVGYQYGSPIAGNPCDRPGCN